MAELEREILIDARPETIWPFLTDPEQLARWQGVAAEIDPRPGGVHRVSLGGGRHPAAGEYVEVVPMERVVYTFGWDEPGHPIPPGSTTVSISLEPDGDKTLVRLVHSGLPEDAVADHTGGWSHYLDRLATVATGGDPGPDRAPG